MHRFNPKHAGRLDDPERLNWQSPEKIINTMDIRESDVIVDYGCGTGFLSIPIARQYPEAKVYGVDISSEMLDLLRQNNPPGNLELALINDGKTDIPDGVADGIVIVNTFHELVEDEQALRELTRLAKSNAKLTVVDWKILEMDFGPRIEERIEPEEVDDILASMGFKTRVIDEQAFPYHYIIKAAKT